MYARAQDCVVRDDARPRVLEQSSVEAFAKTASELLYIQPGFRSAEALVDHPLLKSGQRIMAFGHVVFLAPPVKLFGGFERRWRGSRVCAETFVAEKLMQRVQYCNAPAWTPRSRAVTATVA